MPVLPEVGSMMTEPGFSRPVASASSIMALAMRSLTEPAGLKYSSLARILAFRPCSFFNVGQLQQRSVADQLIRGSINLAHNTLSSLCGRLALLFRGGPGRSHNSINQYGLWV